MVIKLEFELQIYEFIIPNQVGAVCNQLNLAEPEP